MPRKPTGKPPHRPQKEIDWKLVDEYLLSGCKGNEIAAHFDMHHETFYERVRIEKGVGFTEYSQSKKTKGHSLLRHAQFKKALGVGKGDNTMLIWLGKQWLGQKESPNEDINENSNESQQLDSLIKELQNLQSAKSSLNMDKTNNSAV